MSQTILTGSNPKGTQSDNLFHAGVTRTTVLPVDRQILTHSIVTYAEHGKPVFLLIIRKESRKAN